VKRLVGVLKQCKGIVTLNVAGNSLSAAEVAYLFRGMLCVYVVCIYER
jgi:hypothetical protein